MAAVAIPLMIASTVVTAVGAVRQAQAQSGALEYNAQIARQNAQIAEAQGNAAAEQQSRDAQRKLGAAVAAYGAAGVDTSSGSPSDVLADSARSAALDNLTIKYNAKLRALGLQQQAALDSTNAYNTTRAGVVNATSALLSGGSRVAGMAAGTGNVSTT